MLSLFVSDGSLGSSLLAMGNTMVGIALFVMTIGYAYSSWTDCLFPIGDRLIAVFAVFVGFFFLALGIWGLVTFAVLAILALAFCVVCVCVFVVGKKIVNYTMTIAWYCFKLGEKLQEWTS